MRDKSGVAAPPCFLSCQQDAGRGSVEKTVGLSLGQAWFVNGDAVFVGEIFGGNLVILEEESFDFALFGGGVGGGVVPEETQPLYGEAVSGHEGEEATVDDVSGHYGIAFGGALEDLEMDLGLGEGGAGVDGHGLVKHQFGNFGVAAVHASVIDIVGVAAAAFLDFNLGAVGSDDILRGAHAFESGFELSSFGRVKSVGSGNAHGHAENLAEDVPISEHVLFADARGGAFEEEAEVARLAHFNTPVCEIALAVRDTVAPVVAGVNSDASIFGDDVLSRDELHGVVTQCAAVIADDLTELNEGVPPIDGVEEIAEEVGEPFLLEELSGGDILLGVGSDESEILLEDLTLALGDTSGEVSVEDTVGVNVVKAEAIGVFVIDSGLIGEAPVGNILFGEGVGLLLEHGGDADTVLRAEGTGQGHHFGACGPVKPLADACNNVVHNVNALQIDFRNRSGRME